MKEIVNTNSNTNWFGAMGKNFYIVLACTALHQLASPPCPIGKFTFLCKIVVTLEPVMGDSMSKVREKRSTSKSWFFWRNVKDYKVNWWFWPFLTNFCNFGVFLAKNQKYPKMTALKKWKLNENKKFFLKIKELISNIISIILIVWILWFCYFVLSFAIF